MPPHVMREVPHREHQSDDWCRDEDQRKQANDQRPDSAQGSSALRTAHPEHEDGVRNSRDQNGPCGDDEYSGSCSSGMSRDAPCQPPGNVRADRDSNCHQAR